MTRLLLAVISFAPVASACSRPGMSRAGDIIPAALPVAATSMSTINGIQLDLRGSATLRDGWVYVDIPVGAARTYQGRASAWDLLVRAGIATCSGRRRGRLIAEGRAARIAPLVGLTRNDAELDTVARTFAIPLRLEVGIPPGTDLERSWMTIEVSWPIEAVIASYSLTASGGLAHATPDPVAASSARAEDGGSGGRVQAWDAVELQNPPSDVRCS